MLASNLLSADINSLCQLIDKNGNDFESVSTDNFTINECLAFILHSFLPMVHKAAHLKVMEGADLQESLVNLLDIINIKCKFPFSPSFDARG